MQLKMPAALAGAKFYQKIGHFADVGDVLDRASKVVSLTLKFREIAEAQATISESTGAATSEIWHDADIPRPPT